MVVKNMAKEIKKDKDLKEKPKYKRIIVEEMTCEGAQRLAAAILTSSKWWFFYTRANFW